MSVNLNVSKAQISKLRNGHPVQLRHEQIGHGKSFTVHPHTQQKLYRAFKSGKGVRIQFDQDEIMGSGLFDNVKKVGRRALQNKQVQRLKDRAIDKGLDYAIDQSGLDPSVGNFVKKQAKREINRNVDNFVEGGSLAQEYEEYKQGNGLFSKKNLKRGLKKGMKGLKTANKISESLGYDSVQGMVIDNTLRKVDPTGGIASNLLENEIDRQVDKRGGSFRKSGGSFLKQNGSGLVMRPVMKSQIPNGAWVSNNNTFR